MSNYGSYEELAAKATAFDAKQEDIDALGDWFSNYGGRFWNGEYYEIDAEHRLYPIYKEVDEDVYEIVRYEVRI